MDKEGQGSVIKVSRPKRYDPVLAQQAQDLHHARKERGEGERSNRCGSSEPGATLRRKQSLKHDLGLSDLESDSCDSSVEDHEEETEDRAESSSVRREDYELLQQRYMASLVEVNKLGQRERKAVGSMHKLKQICKSQNLVMRQSFRRKMEKSESLIQQLLHTLQTVERGGGRLTDNVDELVASCQRHTEELNIFRRAEASFESEQQQEGVAASTVELHDHIKSLRSENELLQKSVSDLASGERQILQPGEVGDEPARVPSAALKEKYVKAVRVVKASKARIKQVTAEKEELVQLLSEAKRSIEQSNQLPQTTSSPSLPAPALPPPGPETPHLTTNAHIAEIEIERQLREAAEKQVEALSEKLESMQQHSREQRVLQARTQSEQIKSHIAGLKASFSSELKAFKADLATLSKVTQREVDELSVYVEQTKGSIVGRIKRCSIANKEIKNRFEVEYNERRRLLNELQTLRGNVRVLCRVRPVLEHESESEVVVKYPREDCVKLRNSKGREKRWEFAKVFAPEQTNADIFGHVGDLCTSVLDGFNVCIFAYGQTGSGKTYTMEGTAEDRGVNFLALEKLFLDVDELHASQIWQVEVQMSFLEIYNEQIQDLLTENPSGSQRKLEVKQGEHGMYVPNLAVIPIDTHDEVLQLMRLGQQNRSVASTDMNAHSSRSHSMLSVYVSCRNLVTREVSRGKLHLIDLAGSERLAKSGAVGMRKTEAASINKSLSALGDVIHARANKRSHVPYRNSILTYLLQDSLSYDSKTLMFVQISPVSSNAEESFCSLNFASRVQKVELGKASKHVSKEQEE